MAQIIPFDPIERLESSSEASFNITEFRKCVNIVNSSKKWKKQADDEESEPIAETFGFKDFYALIQGVIISPLILIAYLVTLIGSFMPCVLCSIYVQCLPKPLPRISRHLGFHIFSFFMFVITFPIIIFTIFYLSMLLLFIISCSFPIGLLDCRVSIFKNLRTIHPFMNVQWFCWGDIVVCFLGMLHRQGFLEFWFEFPTVNSVIPVLKYLFICNPFLYQLNVKYTNQWTRTLNFTEKEIIMGILRDTSYAINTEKNRDLIDDTAFTVIYPFPPKGRKSQAVVGLQFARNSAVNLTRSAFVTSAHQPRSESARKGIFIVDLFYFNPCHFLTGYVEVNLTKDNALEHPMWCVIGDNFFGKYFYSRVDKVFFNHVVHEAEEFIAANTDLN